MAVLDSLEAFQIVGKPWSPESSAFMRRATILKAIKLRSSAVAPVSAQLCDGGHPRAAAAGALQDDRKVALSLRTMVTGRIHFDITPITQLAGAPVFRYSVRTDLTDPSRRSEPFK
jgi:hypothetical protein